jgi:hypothetical protein
MLETPKKALSLNVSTAAVQDLNKRGRFPVNQARQPLPGAVLVVLPAAMMKASICLSASGKAKIANSLTIARWAESVYSFNSRFPLITSILAPFPFVY